MNFSISEENYLKSIFHLQPHEGTVTTNELAQALSTKPASVTDMMKKLKGKKLVNYERYKGFRLTTEGRKIALLIVRRHRLWEYFLSEKLKFSWDEVHQVAEELEHVSNRKLVDKLDEFLGYPRTDPHGDPIPDQNGKMETLPRVSLNELQENSSATVCHVADQSADILELLKHKNIQIGTKLAVRKKFSFDRSMEVKIKGQSSFTISEKLAQNIFVHGE